MQKSRRGPDAGRITRWRRCSKRPIPQIGAVRLTASATMCSLDRRRWISGHLLPPGPRARTKELTRRTCPPRFSGPGGFLLPPTLNQVRMVRFQPEMCCRICMCPLLTGWTGYLACMWQEAES